MGKVSVAHHPGNDNTLTALKLGGKKPSTGLAMDISNMPTKISSFLLLIVLE